MSLLKKMSRLSPRASACVVFAAVMGGSTAVMSYLYLQAVQHREQALQRHVRDLAVAGAAMVDVDLHESLVRPDQLGSAEYRAALAPLVKFHRNHDSIQYLWTTRVLEPGRQLFLLETSTDESIRRHQLQLGRSQDLLDFLAPDPETAAGAKSIPLLRQGQAWVSADIYADAHGRYIEARAPLFTKDGRFVGYLGVDYALDSYQAQLNEVRVAGLVSLALALALSVGLARVMGEIRRQTLGHLAEVQRQRELADQANRAKSELLAIATHDLKNPLSAIAGMSGLLLKQKKRSDPAAAGEEIEVLGTIHASAQHMAEIVRGILLNEGIEFGGVEFHPAPTDLVKVCRDILRFNTPAATRKQITFRMELPESLVMDADAKLLREAFDNYLSNAIKYSPPGRTVSVKLGHSTAGGMVEFAVRDEGPGLSAGDQAMLFQKFKRLTPRPTAGESSTGLGLSIVKTVAERHGGSVGCESSPGQGARFWLRLPAGPR